MGFGERRKKTTDSLLAAPQGHLVQDGEVFNPETAVESLLKRLESSPNMTDNIAVIHYYAKHTDFVPNNKMRGSIAYDPDRDVIFYNLSKPLPKGVDRDGILVHELSHRADHLMYEASTNLIWQNAVKQMKSAILGREQEIENWFAKDGLYRKDAFFSDIIDAISSGTLSLPFGHDALDWENSHNLYVREKEIFANIMTMDIIETEGVKEFPQFLKPLHEAFKKIVVGGV